MVDQNTPYHRAKKRIRWFLYFLLLGLLGGMFALGLVSWNLPSMSSLQNFRPSVSSEVFSEEYIKIGEFSEERRIFVPLQHIPATVVNAFVASEDAAFFHHGGISISGILRAFAKNIVAGEVKQGGSTITQQVAKQLLLSPERSLIRKIREAFLATKMEKFLTKEQILEIYLNQIYLGHGSYGVQAAANTFFDKDVSDLTLGEAAMLAGLTRAPSRDNPFTDLTRATEQKKYVLSRLKDEGWISNEEQVSALEEKTIPVLKENLNLRFAPYFVEHVRRLVTEKYGDDLVLHKGLQIFTTLQVKPSLAAQAAIRAGLEEMDRHQGYRGPLQTLPEKEWPAFIQKMTQEMAASSKSFVRLDSALVLEVKDSEKFVFIQVGAEWGVILLEDMKWARKPDPEKLWTNNLITKPSQALTHGDVIWVKRLGEGIPSEIKNKLSKKAARFALAQIPVVQGALVSLDPQTGFVRAMVGGYDFEASEFNRATQARRQPGSAFKPIIYSAALDKGYTAASIIVDSPLAYDDPSVEFRWRPKNYGGDFYGNMIFRDCLVESRNLPTIKIVQDIGIEAVLDNAKKLGITSPLARDHSLALGSSGVTPLELVSAYSVFASGGKKFEEPIFIKKILDRDGNLLERNSFEDPALPLSEQVVKITQVREEETERLQAEEAGIDPETEELPPHYALSPQTSFIMTHLLKQVISSGTGQRAAAINRPAAGKTGTTNENQDAWFVGYTPNLIAGVWIGFDEVKSLGVMEEGGRAASPIWLSFMQQALENIPTVDFPLPPGIVTVPIDSKTGKLATPTSKRTFLEVFKEGTEPKETSDETSPQKSSQQFFLEE